MNPHALTISLTNFPDLLRAATTGLSVTQFRWKPDDISWSILEILHHIYDEEREDFRIRLCSTLEDNTRPWPGIDPEAAARDRRYNDADPESILSAFVEERAASMQWLSSLFDVDWNCAYEHPSIGALRAGDLLLSWAAHDMLHLRQITKRRFQILNDAASEFQSNYAGDW